MARGKQPVLKLVPLRKEPKKREPGMYRGEFELGPAFFEPLPPGELLLWE
jgi:antitoxin (DNA-binding transcriptional repressor) of toxin-antitoxin stability system